MPDDDKRRRSSSAHVTGAAEFAHTYTYRPVHDAMGSGCCCPTERTYGTDLCGSAAREGGLVPSCLAGSWRPDWDDALGCNGATALRAGCVLSHAASVSCTVAAPT